MRPSLRLGRIAGIEIGLHWTIVLIAAVLTFTLSGNVLPAFAAGYTSTAYLVAALVTSALFLASITAHELGHSLVALRNGIKVKGITLFALGGVASLSSEPTRPGAAARIALAGPGVSLGIGVASFGAAAGLAAVGAPSLVAASLLWLGVINLVLAVFNMLPALPLDGGRVLQAWLWHRKGDRHQATISAAGLGRWVGWGLVAFGFWEVMQGATTGLWTMLIGWFVLGTAKAEAVQARMELQRERQQFPFGFFDPFGAPPPTAPPTAEPRGTGAGPGGTGQPWPPASWPPPRPQDRYADDDVIEVGGYRVGPR